MDSPEFWDEVFLQVATGVKIQKVARNFDTHWASLWKRISADADLKTRYYNAKEGIGEFAYFGIQEFVERTTNERAKLEALKWLAQVSNPDRYSEKQHIKLEQSVSQQHVDELRELARMKDVTPEVKKIGE